LHRFKHARYSWKLEETNKMAVLDITISSDNKDMSYEKSQI